MLLRCCAEKIGMSCVISGREGRCALENVVEAVYEDGVLKPVEPLTGLAEHCRVQVTVRLEKPRHPLADCLGTMPDEDAEEIRRVVEEEFERVDLDEWK